MLGGDGAHTVLAQQATQAPPRPAQADASYLGHEYIELDQRICTSAVFRHGNRHARTCAAWRTPVSYVIPAACPCRRS
jgi:hypothetical protein